MWSGSKVCRAQASSDPAHLANSAAQRRTQTLRNFEARLRLGAALTSLHMARPHWTSSLRHSVDEDSQKAAYFCHSRASEASLIAPSSDHDEDVGSKGSFRWLGVASGAANVNTSRAIPARCDVSIVGRREWCLRILCPTPQTLQRGSKEEAQRHDENPSTQSCGLSPKPQTLLALWNLGP